MATTYDHHLWNQLQDALAAVDILRDEIRSLKDELHDLKVEQGLRVTEIRAEYRKEMEQLTEKYEASIAGQAGRITTLEAENARLKAITNKNSSNSGKPPSSDGYKKPNKSLREKSGKRPGGQPGHKGHIPILCETPDEAIDERKPVCDCGGHVAYGAPVRRQVVDIEIKRHVTEHLFGEGECTICGKRVTNPVPQKLANPVTIGDSLKALAVYLAVEGAVSVERTERIISQMSGGEIHLSGGSIVNFISKLAAKLVSGGTFCAIGDKLVCSDVLHKDETGVRMNGGQYWLHVLCSGNATLYGFSKKRGAEADIEMGILGSYGGILVHDHWKSLYTFLCGHAECNMHVLRYLMASVENDKIFSDIAKQLFDLLIEMNNARNTAIIAGKKQFAAATIRTYEKRYMATLTEWADITDAAQKERKARRISEKYKAESENLGKRLLEYKSQHLLFLRDFRVPFGNNEAERNLRMGKTKMKVSGCFRSEKGGRDYAVIRSYVATALKNGINVFDGLRLAFADEPVPLF